MKYENIINGLGATLVIIGAIMKISHLAYGNSIIFLGLIVSIVFQAWFVSQLKKKIKELESK